MLPPSSGIDFILFGVFVFTIELFLLYAPLYIISYKVLAFDRKVEDKKLSVVLLIISFLLAAFLFPIALNIAREIIA